ncbi:hypothetical protein DH2020_012106 [Rehmannia glutinosa]|uniref:Retrotransposon Copia-like N-terminal domain-containing protein n=1 Tax=Rehmannia glutinosa TaxID=99300 RepID=A0ABR0XFT8_REHGL
MVTPIPAIDDPSNVYYLHHSDNPGLVLVSQLLTGDNYASWSRAMQIALSVKNKLGFIDGSLQKPAGTNRQLLQSWTRNNNIVISWILNSVSKEICASIIFSDSARSIWLDLQKRFQQSNDPRLFQLRRDLMNLKQDNMSIGTYFTKLKTLWEELGNFRPNCSCGHCTCGEEQQRKIGNYSDISAPNLAFVVSNSARTTNPSHMPNTSSSSKPPKRDRPFCTHFNQVTTSSIHTIGESSSSQPSPGDDLPALNHQQCQQLIALLSSRMSTFSMDSQPQAHDNTHSTGTCFSVSLDSSISSSQFWIVDSGASRHICCHRHAFLSLRPFNASVILPNDMTVEACYSGDVQLSPWIVLKDVLYLPRFKFNLLAVSALLHHTGYMIKFDENQFIIQDNQSQKMIGKGDYIDGLYVLDSKKLSPAPVTAVNNISTSDSSYIWHTSINYQCGKWTGPIETSSPVGS